MWLSLSMFKGLASFCHSAGNFGKFFSAGDVTANFHLEASSPRHCSPILKICRAAESDSWVLTHTGERGGRIPSVTADICDGFSQSQSFQLE